ncbi:MAG: amidase, partial [Pseudacidovorax sp.]|nr:amidase [Pseudacidovorax sp.]
FLTQLPTDGPIARNVDDLELMLQVMAGPDVRVPLSAAVPSQVFRAAPVAPPRKPRIGWLGDYGGYLPLEDGMLAACEKALKPFEAMGHQVVEVSLPMAPQALWQTWLVLRHMHAFSSLKNFYDDPAQRTYLKPEALWEVEQGVLLTAADLSAAFQARSDWYRGFCSMFDTLEFLVLPSTQVFPFSAEVSWPREVGGVQMDTYHRWQENMLPATLAGAPAMSLPAGFSTSGLPFGLQVIAKPHGDRQLLALARQYEQATTADR